MPPHDGQKDNTQTVAIPVHLSFPHSATFEGTNQKQSLIKEQQRKERRETGTKSHRMQTLRQTRRQWLRTRSAKEHKIHKMQLQPQVQRLEAEVSMGQIEDKVQGVVQIRALTVWGSDREGEGTAGLDSS